MKIIIAALILAGTFTVMEAQVDFRQINSSEEMNKVWTDAQSQNKPVFVDIYATWCGPCKWMDANVFAMESAGDYMNSEFINVKMDGESEFGRIFAAESRLSAYPSFFVYNSSKELMNTVVGAKPWEELEPQLISTLEFYPVLEIMDNKFKSGLLERDEYPRYLKALREMGKEELGSAVAYSYEKEFVNGGEMTIEDIQVLAFYTKQQTDSWKSLTSDISKLKLALDGELEKFIDHAVTSSIQSGVENTDIEYVSAMNEILPQLSEGTNLDPAELESISYIYYYHYSELFDEMIGFIDNEFETRRRGDHKWLFEAAANAVFLDPQNVEVAEKGLEWFQACIDLQENQEYYYHLALCEYFTDSPEKTIATLNKSMEFTDDPEIIQSTKSIISQVEEELANQ
ncbi:MAG: thioredoxin family protein [Bacteroidales bacterium]